MDLRQAWHCLPSVAHMDVGHMDDGVRQPGRVDRMTGPHQLAARAGDPHLETVGDPPRADDEEVGEIRREQVARRRLEQLQPAIEMRALQ